MNRGTPLARRLRVRARPHALPVGQALRLAFALLEQQRVEEARGLFEAVRTAAPFHPTALTMLASLAYRQGNEPLGEAYLEQAIEVYRRALAKSPGEPGLLAPLVNLLLAREQEETALRYARELDMPLNPLHSDHAGFAARIQRARALGMPTVLLVTIPKSASETIWNRLAGGLALAQAHLSLGLFPHCLLLPCRLRAVRGGGLAAKEHIFPSQTNLALLAEAGLRRVFVHLRDPRQATLSWAHFVLHDISRRKLGPLWRRTVPPRAVLERGFEAVLDWSIERVLPLYVAFARAWTRFAEAGRGFEIALGTYEAFLDDPTAYLRSILAHFGIDAAAYDHTAAAAAESVHLRRGRKEEWREVFTARQRRRTAALLDPELCRRYGWKE